LLIARSGSSDRAIAVVYRAIQSSDQAIAITCLAIRVAYRAIRVA